MRTVREGTVSRKVRTESYHCVACGSFIRSFDMDEAPVAAGVAEP